MIRIDIKAPVCKSIIDQDGDLQNHVFHSLLGHEAYNL